MHELLGQTSANILHAQNMQEAVAFAYQHTPKGKVCLLSTACPYGLWKSYQERGLDFQKTVKELAPSA